MVKHTTWNYHLGLCSGEPGLLTKSSQDTVRTVSCTEKAAGETLLSVHAACHGGRGQRRRRKHQNKEKRPLSLPSSPQGLRHGLRDFAGTETGTKTPVRGRCLVRCRGPDSKGPEVRERAKTHPGQSPSGGGFLFRITVLICVLSARGMSIRNVRSESARDILLRWFYLI